MKRKKLPVVHKPVGRPTEFRDEYCERARDLCLVRNAIDKELAEHFDVSEVTLRSWKKKYPQFLAAIKEGKDVADSRVAARLYERATGYSHPDTHISNYQGEITATPIIKHYPPDATSAIFWLKNRQPDKWRDRSEVALNVTLAALVSDQGEKTVEEEK